MWWLLACLSPDPPALDLPPMPRFLTGRLDADKLLLPALPGRDELQKICGVLRPCRRERWSVDPEDPERDALYLQVIGERGTLGAIPWEGEKIRTSWKSMGLLRVCVGDPLRTPPAEDPGGIRVLEAGQWLLLFSGKNLCGLEGRLLLPLQVDRADAGALLVEGQPWMKGGRGRARERIWSWLETILPADWARLSLSERSEILEALDMATDEPARELHDRLTRLSAP